MSRLDTGGRLDGRIRVAFPGFALDAELDLPLNGLTAVFGASGCGKSTLLRALAGLEPRARGRVAVNGETWQDDEAGLFLQPHRRALGFVFQDARLFPHLSVRGNLAYGHRRRGAAGALDLERVAELLDLGPLMERRPGGLSGGETQRVAIARAVLAAPRLLIMDEPLASLDARRKGEILPFIERLRDELELPILYVSHAMEEVVRLADTLALMSAGRIVATGGVEELTSRLDLYPLTGRYAAGAVIGTTVAGHDERFRLTRLAFADGELTVPRVDLPEGAFLRLRIRARDVSLMTEPPGRTSVLNVLEGRVLEISEEGESQVDVRLAVGADRGRPGTPLIARVTRKAAHDLELAPGAAVYALVKAIAIDRHSMGRWNGSRRIRRPDRITP